MHCRYTLYQNISRKAKIDGSDSTMMNRSTQKELIKLMLQLNEMWPQLDLSNPEQQNMVLDILNTVSTKCQKDFSKANADRYADTMESLGQVIKMTDWQYMGREELTQCVSLCQDIILQVINNLRNEKELKKDIVFLPYKASMWDSLESVWKAAYEDKEHCNTYVIPIPYADLNPDRSIAKWHCEREQFPKYVPTLDWREIDLEKWHPDIIFIHNPYDNYNYITSVESRYYAQNLKHCTNKLVYIPYFVLEEPCMEESVEHFVLTAGVLNADKVIVQSEAMRELYINILIKKTNHTDRKYWEKRILGAGSPKIEKVLTSKKENFEMPEKWRKLVIGKKVILYNTSLFAALQNADKVCDKLCCIFDVFRNRNDVILWWRPHPLMKSTFHAMRPQFEEEYLRLEKQYIEEGWGIYDDSPDLHRAICWSDAYYGDASSVLLLYKVTCKPRMLQKITDISDKENSVCFENFVKQGDKLWGISKGHFLGLYEMDLRTGSTVCLGEIPTRYTRVLPWLVEYSALGKVENKLVIAPYFSMEDFIEYDFEKKKFHNLQVRYKSYLKNNPKRIYPEFTNVAQWNKSLFFIGNGTGVIVDYSLLDKKVSYHSLSNHIDEEYTALFASHGVQVERYLYMSILESNKVVRLDLETFDTKLYIIPYGFKGREIIFDGDYFWVLSDFRDSIVKCKFEQNIYKLINTQEMFTEESVCCYLFLQTKRMKESFLIKSDENSLFILGSDKILEKFDYNTRNIEQVNQILDVSAEMKYRYSSNNMMKNQTLDESVDMNLIDFLSFKLKQSCMHCEDFHEVGIQILRSIL